MSKPFFCIAMQQERINVKNKQTVLQYVGDYLSFLCQGWERIMIQRHSINQDLSIFFCSCKMSYGLRVFIWSSQKESARFMKESLQTYRTMLPCTSWTSHDGHKGSSSSCCFFGSPDAKVFLDRHSVQVQENNSTLSDKDAPSGYFPGHSPAAERERETRAKSYWMWLLQSTWILFRSHALMLIPATGWSADLNCCSPTGFITYPFSFFSSSLPLQSSLGLIDRKQ